MTGNGNEWMPIGKMIDEKVVVNGIVALLATGGSTNHTMHTVAMARAAGIQINWDDFSDLSDVVPLMARLYPNGPADINHFRAAGGVPVLVRELLKAGLLHEDVNTVAGFGLSRYTLEPWLNNGELDWREGAEKSLDSNVIASFEQPFSHHGGTKVLSGNTGRAVMKTSAVPVENRVIEAPAVVLKASMTLCRPLKRVCWTAIVSLLSVIRGQKRTECQNYINSCRHLVYYWTGVSKLR